MFIIIVIIFFRCALMFECFIKKSRLFRRDSSVSLAVLSRLAFRESSTPFNLCVRFYGTTRSTIVSTTKSKERVEI